MNNNPICGSHDTKSLRKVPKSSPWGRHLSPCCTLNPSIKSAPHWSQLISCGIAEGPGFRGPVIVVHCDALKRSRIATTVCVPLTSNLKWSLAPGNLKLSASLTGLPQDSVVTVDKELLAKRVVHRRT